MGNKGMYSKVYIFSIFLPYILYYYMYFMIYWLQYSSIFYNDIVYYTVQHRERERGEGGLFLVLK